MLNRNNQDKIQQGLSYCLLDNPLRDDIEFEYLNYDCQLIQKHGGLKAVNIRK